MKQIFRIIFALLAILPLHLSAQDLVPVVPNDTLQERMRVEEVRFRLRMGNLVQEQQRYAVMKAIEGDTAQLQQVRRGRSAEPTIPTDIDTLHLTPTLTLFRPHTAGNGRRPVLFYLHGGGWCLGSINSCARFCMAVARKADCCVVALNYRLAPETPYPAALDDCQAALAYIKLHAAEWGADTTAVHIGGDSAGGNLALATALTEDGVNGVVAIYPVTKLLTENSVSWLRYGEGYGNNASLLEAFNQAYTGKADPHDWKISVGFAPDSVLARLPHTAIISAGHDILADQGREFANRLQRTVRRGVNYYLFPTATHLFITVDGQPTAFDEAVGITANEINGKARSSFLPAPLK